VAFNAAIFGGIRLDKAVTLMGPSLYRKSPEGLVHDDFHAALERDRHELMRVRLELAELKRTGSRQGLATLTSDAAALSMRIRRFETIASETVDRQD
jgi:hypothetical protein